ncbi:hypothetical protein PIROE2DRAFT_5724 [Piromyces sp. E2]|nr:hypothetical protein PIROE2DRAFT_5724 [Piromyces sp. E2]|eukprot:OUM66981.1 hypothetical protein PIROE2DRAFT_5724 [Piromyces sp. E2]
MAVDLNNINLSIINERLNELGEENPAIDNIIINIENNVIYNELFNNENNENNENRIYVNQFDFVIGNNGCQIQIELEDDNNDDKLSMRLRVDNNNNNEPLQTLRFGWLFYIFQNNNQFYSNARLETKVQNEYTTGSISKNRQELENINFGVNISFGIYIRIYRMEEVVDSIITDDYRNYRIGFENGDIIDINPQRNIILDSCFKEETFTFNNNLAGTIGEPFNCGGDYEW